MRVGSGLGELRARKPGSTGELDQAVRLTKHDVKVRISGQVARTEIDETFTNDTGDVLEGIYRFPMPPDAQIERLALEVDGRLEEGAFVDKDRAAAIWRGVIQAAAPKSPKPRDEIIWVPGPCATRFARMAAGGTIRITDLSHPRERFPSRHSGLYPIGPSFPGCA